jgi:hypothetical protein
VAIRQHVLAYTEMTKSMKRLAPKQRAALTGVAVMLSLAGVIAVASSQGSGGETPQARTRPAATGPGSASLTPQVTDCTDPRMTDCTAGEREAAARYKAEQATSTTSGSLMTRDEAVAEAQSDGNGFATYEDVNRVDAKLVRMGDLRHALAPGEIWSSDDDDPAWAVVIGGKVTSHAGDSVAVGFDPNYSWGLTVYNAKTRMVTLFYPGKTEWPEFWDSLAPYTPR